MLLLKSGWNMLNSSTLRQIEQETIRVFRFARVRLVGKLLAPHHHRIQPYLTLNTIVSDCWSARFDLQGYFATLHLKKILIK